MGGEIDLQACSTFKRSPKFSFTSAPTLADKKKDIPGPGQYKLIGAEKDKYTRTPQWSITSAPRDSGKAWGSLPGPGAYSPANPAFVSPKWLFSSDSRLRTIKRASTPGPGAYDTRGKPEGVQVSIVSKPECKPRSVTPGPGQYRPLYEGCSNMLSSPKVSFGASMRKDLVLSKTPGPGAYDSLTSLGGKKFSIKGRYDPPAPFVTPDFCSAGSTFK